MGPVGGPTHRTSSHGHFSEFLDSPPPTSEYASARLDFCQFALRTHERIEDAITGVELKIIDQTLNLKTETIENKDLSVGELENTIDPEDLVWTPLQEVPSGNAILDFGNHSPVDTPGCLKLLELGREMKACPHAKSSPIARQTNAINHTEHGRALRARREVGSGQHSKRDSMRSCRGGARKSSGKLSASSPDSCLKALCTDARELSGKRHRSAPDSFLETLHTAAACPFDALQLSLSSSDSCRDAPRTATQEPYGNPSGRSPDGCREALRTVVRRHSG